MIALKDYNSNFAHFDEHGRLCRFRSRGQEWAPAEPGTGWSIVLTENSTRRTATATRNATPSRKAGPDRVLFTFEELRLDDGRVISARVVAEWQLADGLLQGGLAISGLPVAMQIAEFVMPDLTFTWTEAKDTSLVTPRGIGYVLHEVAVGLATTNTPIAYDTMEFQCFGWAEGRRGLYLDTRDTEGWVKSWRFSHAGDNRVHIEAGCPAPGDADAVAGCPLPYRVSLGGFDGNWFDVAQIYRQWALAQPWAARGPEQRRNSFFADIACWLWNRGSIARVAPPSKELARRIGAPTALDWYWWHKHGYDTEYPDYFPPREGVEKFRRAVADLQAANVRVQVYTNGMACDMDGGTWEPIGPRTMLVKKDGSFKAVAFNKFTKHRLAYACGAAAEWHDQMADVATQARALGLDGLYLDMIGAAGGYQACHSTKHGHAPGGGWYGIQGFRKLFQRIRQMHPGFPLSTEATQEMYMDLVEGYIILDTSSERCTGCGRTKESIPLFTAIYHGRAVCFGNYALVDGIPPFDDLWPQECRPDPKAEKDWNALCPDQFAFELARTVAFGCQPMVCNLTDEQLADPRFTADIAFLVATARFYHQNREHLLWGTMLPPGELVCEIRPVRFLKRFIFTKPGKEKFIEVPRPVVLHSVWQAPDGQNRLVLINHSREPQPVAYRPAAGWRVDDGIPSGWSCSDGLLRSTIPPRMPVVVPLRQA